MTIMVVTWSSWLKIIVPAAGKVTLAVLTVNVPLRLARQEPEANVIVLAGVAAYWKSRVAPLLIWSTAELAIAFALLTNSRPLFTVMVPMVLALSRVENEVAATARKPATTADRAGQGHRGAAHGNDSATGIERDRPWR